MSILTHGLSSADLNGDLNARNGLWELSRQRMAAKECLERWRWARLRLLRGFEPLRGTAARAFRLKRGQRLLRGLWSGNEARPKAGCGGRRSSSYAPGPAWTRKEANCEDYQEANGARAACWSCCTWLLGRPGVYVGD